MTLAEYRKRRPAPEAPAETAVEHKAQGRGHPGPLEYAVINPHEHARVRLRVLAPVSHVMNAHELHKRHPSPAVVAEAITPRLI